MANIFWDAAAIVSLATTELNSLANNAGALGVEYNNATNLYVFGMFQLEVTFGTNPTAGSAIKLYLIPAPDGTNYADNTTGASGYAPPGSYVGSFILQAKTTIHRLTLQGVGPGSLVPLPPTRFKAFLINGSGQSFPASGSTLKMIPYRYQST